MAKFLWVRYLIPGPFSCAFHEVLGRGSKTIAFLLEELPWSDKGTSEKVLPCASLGEEKRMETWTASVVQSMLNAILQVIIF